MVLFDLSSLSRSYFVEWKRFGHFETDRHTRTHGMRLCVSMRSASPDQDTGPNVLAASDLALWWGKTVVDFRVGRMHTPPAGRYPRVRGLPRWEWIKWLGQPPDGLQNMRRRYVVRPRSSVEAPRYLP